jgi:hypothetical protein
MTLEITSSKNIFKLAFKGLNEKQDEQNQQLIEKWLLFAMHSMKI